MIVLVLFFPDLDRYHGLDLDDHDDYPHNALMDDL